MKKHIMVVYDAPGVSLADYEPYEAEIRELRVPPEALVHQVAVNARGLMIVDIWSDVEAFKAWTKERIKPILAKHKLPYVTPRIFKVDVVATPGALAETMVLKTRAPRAVANDVSDGRPAYHA